MSPPLRSPPRPPLGKDRCPSFDLSWKFTALFHVLCHSLVQEFIVCAFISSTSLWASWKQALSLTYHWHFVLCVCAHVCECVCECVCMCLTSGAEGCMCFCFIELHHHWSTKASLPFISIHIPSPFLLLCLSACPDPDTNTEHKGCSANVAGCRRRVTNSSWILCNFTLCRLHWAAKVEKDMV